MKNDVDETLRQQAQALVKAETKYLNDTDLDNWIALFTENGYYWMPLEEAHQNPEMHDSLIYDNRDLMQMRKYNLGNPLSPSMQHKIRSVRILSDLEISDPNKENDQIKVDASVIAVISHKQQNYYAGKVQYLLEMENGQLKIQSKRVDLLNADAPLDVIMMYI